MKMLDFENSEGSKMDRFRSRNGLESKKTSGRGKKVVSKGLGMAVWTGNCAIPLGSPRGRGTDKSIPNG